MRETSKGNDQEHGCADAQMMTAQRAARPMLVASRSGTPRSTGAPLSESTLQTCSPLPSGWPRIGCRCRAGLSLRHKLHAGEVGADRCACPAACCRRQNRSDGGHAIRAVSQELSTSTHCRDARRERPSLELQRMQHSVATGEVQTEHVDSIAVPTKYGIKYKSGPRGRLDEGPQYGLAPTKTSYILPQNANALVSYVFE